MTTDDLRVAARDVIGRFDWPDARVTSLNRTLNAVFRIYTRDGIPFVLRMRSGERFDDAAASVQLRWLEWLHRKTALGTPLPMRTRAGRRFVHVRIGDERWRVTCLTWVVGRAPKGPSFLRPPTLKAIGRAVGELHAASARFRPAGIAACPQLNARHFFGPDTVAGAVGRAYLSTAEHDVIRRAADRIRRAMRRVRDSAAHVGLIHGDLEPPNWVIAAGVPRPIDFDEFGVGPFAFDLMQVLWTHALWPDYPRYRTDLLSGYESVRPIPAEDRLELDLYQAIPFIHWLRRGSDPAGRDEFRKWAGPTVRRVGELCGVT